MRGIWRCGALLLVCALAGAQESGDVARSTRVRNTEPEVAAGDILNVAGSANKFSMTMLRSQSLGDENILCSPYSVWTSLAMAYAGAREQTAAEMIRALGVNFEPRPFHAAVNAMSLQLAAHSEPKEGQPGHKLVIANALWGQKGKEFLPGFLATLAVNYGAGVRLVDYRRDVDGARATINGWVDKQTNSKIKDLIPPGGINGATRLVLTNTVYFIAPWQSPFPKEATAPDDWLMLNGQKVGVPFMKQTGAFGYVKTDSWQMVELPYVGGQLVLDLITCNSTVFREHQSSFSIEMLGKLLAGLKPTNVELTLPRFGVGASMRLKPMLRRLGLASAFDFSADFSGMDGNRELSLSDVLHKAWIKVDEVGTEAAAATAAPMAVTAVPGDAAKLKFDHPFMLVLRDVPTGLILFVGRVMDPRA